jgi:hypothetical protein
MQAVFGCHSTSAPDVDPSVEENSDRGRSIVDAVVYINIDAVIVDDGAPYPQVYMAVDPDRDGGRGSISMVRMIQFTEDPFRVNEYGYGWCWRQH